MVENHYRWDFIGLSTDDKPTPATSEKVADGSTFYCSDNSKLYVFYKDQWYEKEATGGGGTTYEDFVGTDGEEAGTHGLVPAPATTDAGKYLKADGTWAEIASGGGDVKTLTSADVNYPEEEPNVIRAWLLQPGDYQIDNVPVYYTTSNYTSNGLLMVGKAPGNNQVPLIVAGEGRALITIVINKSTNAVVDFDQNNNPVVISMIVDALNSNSSKKVLSANQGKVLNDKIGDLSSLTTTDKTSIVAAINELASRL